MRMISRGLTLVLALLTVLSGCSPTTEIRVATSDVSLTEKLSFEQGRTLVDRGKVAEAITVFRKLLRTGGPSLPVLNGLAIAHAEMGRPDLAATFFAKALAIAPDDPATLNNIGFAAIRRKEAKLARLYLERAVRTGGDMPTIRRNLEIVERLEVLGAPSAAVDTALFSQPGSKIFTVVRQTASSVRLSGMQASPRQSRSPSAPTAMPSRGVIDFSELYDPWSMSDRPTEPSF